MLTPWSRKLITGSVLALAVVLCWRYFVPPFVLKSSDSPKREKAVRHSSSTNLVQVDLVAPSDVPVMAARSVAVKFNYRIVNRSKAALTGLELGIGCKCQLGKKLPDSLKAGEEATCSISVNAPLAGTRMERITITAKGHDEPIAVLFPAVRVEASPPELVHVMPVIDWNRISGDSAPNQVVMQTIERRKDPRWLGASELKLGEVTLPVKWTVTERPADDPNLVLRRYEGTVSTVGISVGHHHGTWATVTHGPQLPEVSCHVKVLPVLSLLPERLEFLKLDEQRRLTLVDRMGNNDVKATWDRALLNVTPVENGTKAVLQYQVSWLADAPPDGETQITFTAMGHEPLAAVVVRRLTP